MTFTVQEAQSRRMCRICGGPSSPTKELGSFVLNYGKEFAHEKCLERERAQLEVVGTFVIIVGADI